MQAFQLTIHVKSYNYHRVVDISCPPSTCPEDIIAVFLQDENLDIPKVNPGGAQVSYALANQENQLITSCEELKMYDQATLTLAPEGFFLILRERTQQVAMPGLRKAG